MQPENHGSRQEVAAKPRWPHVVSTWTAAIAGAFVWQLVFEGSLVGLLVTAAVFLCIELVFARVLLFLASGTSENAPFAEVRDRFPTAPAVTTQAMHRAGTFAAGPLESGARGPMADTAAGRSDDPVESIVQKYVSRIRDKHVYFSPNIPAKKLESAIAAYASQARFEKPLLLIDNTIFGNAKDGLLLTASRVYSHNIMEEAQVVCLDSIEGINWNEGILNSHLLVNGTKFYENSLPSNESMRFLAFLLAEIAAIYHPECFQDENQENSALGTLRELKRLVSEGIVSEEELEEKKKELLSRV